MASSTSAVTLSNSSSPSNSSFLSQTFNTPISLKLDEINFLIWKQQVMATIRGLKLLHFLDKTATSQNFLNVGDQMSNMINPKFLEHE
ncbi:hypothetical protein VIGAN_01262900 [Vigna angularis var. angularis]|uniref:Retrotransposon Copia-like N-terminal domain-containing protein n=1 Tax=Vigna angularis var. angularis TaxID=157739 RepID=A0A0S3R2Y1_PHAAN|nr:hypothetical protein VIGAN_01262900 [Vigna angularis var. angularis]